MVNKYSELKNLLYKDTIQNLFKINITLSIPITYIFKSLNNDKMYDNKRLWKQFLYISSLLSLASFFLADTQDLKNCSWINLLYTETTVSYKS